MLLRWHSALLGEVSPVEFIPVAEQTGLFGILDQWVVRNAFAKFNQLKKHLNGNFILSINLSSASLTSLDLAGFIIKQAKINDIMPSEVEFEVTETFASDSENYPLLNELSQLGFGLTIDDFGVHHTSLSQLIQYPIKNIKFGRKF